MAALFVVREGVEGADFIDATGGGERVEVAGVAPGERSGFGVARAEEAAGVGLRGLGIEKVEPEPFAVHGGQLRWLPKKGHEEDEDEVGVDLRLEFEVSGVGFVAGRDGATLKLESGVKRVVDLFDEGDEFLDIVIAEAGAGIVLFELIDDPA